MAALLAQSAIAAAQISKQQSEAQYIICLHVLMTFMTHPEIQGIMMFVFSHETILIQSLSTQQS